MTVYKTDFSEFPTGAKPTGWDTTIAGTDKNVEASDARWQVVADAAATGGQALEYNNPIGQEAAIHWPDVPISEHQRAQIRWKAVGQNNSDVRMLCRASNTAVNTGYTLGVRRPDLDINKYDAGSFSNFANDAGGYTAQAGTWYRTECEVVGINPTTLRVKTWPESGTKPATWSELGGGPEGAITDTDSTDIESGGFGLLGFQPDTAYVDWVVVTDAGEAPEFTATSTITDINTNNEVVPGTTATLTGTNLTGATGFNIGSEAQADFTVVSDTSITFTTVRGGNPYNQNLTGTLLHPDGNATITVQQVPESGTFAVTAASPNTTDDASLWTGLIDTATSNPITIVDGDQAWVKNPNNLTNLAIQPDGTITADQEGDFVVQIWLLSEGVWGSDQTVTFAVPDDVAPVFSVAPAVAATNTTGHTISATIDEGGTLYGVRLADGATAPSSAQVKAGQDAAGAAAPEAKSVAATASTSADLVFSTASSDTPYDYYVVAEDDASTPNIQASPALVEATTSIEPPPPSVPGSGRRGFLRPAVRGTVNSIIGSIIS